MKKYKVNVNGTVYEITLEDISGSAPAAAPAPAAPLPHRLPPLLLPLLQLLPMAKRSPAPCPVPFSPSTLPPVTA